MNKNGTTLTQKIGFVILLVTGLIVAIGLAIREPSYSGRPLSSWLKDLEGLGTDPDSPAANAIKSMGTATIPYLLDMLSPEEPSLRKKIRTLAEIFSLKLADPQMDSMRAVTASYALNILGTNAEPAFAALTNSFYEENTVCSAIALAGIGSKGTQFLLTELTNRDPRLRQGAVNGLGEARGDYEDVVFALTHILITSKEQLMRSAAANNLGRLRQHPDISIPSLIEGLSDEDANVRGMAIISLGQFGHEAKAAIPALTEALNDSDSVNVKLAMQALEKVLSINKVDPASR